MPINLPNGANVEEIVLPNGSQAERVIGPDGSTVWERVAIPDSVILPESDDLNHFEGDVGSFDINSDAPVIYTDDNNLSLKQTSGGAKITSTSGLNRYPERGEQFSYYVRSNTEAADPQVFFGLQDGSNHYSVLTRLNNDKINLRKDDNNLDITNASLAADEWFEVEVDWSDAIEARIYSLDGTTRQSELASVSATDSEYDGGGVGFESLSDTGLAVYDYYRVTSIL